MSHNPVDPDPGAPLPREIRAALVLEGHVETARLAEIWNLAGSYYGQEPRFEAEGAQIWPALEAAIAPPVPRLRLVTAPWRAARPMRYAALAACIAVLLAVGITLSDTAVQVKAPQGEQIAHTLPDGTQLLLNSGTRLRYNKDFNDETRGVRLTRGEVLFDVTSSAKPFRVQTFNSTITVLGTSFSVRAWPSESDASTDVAVREGRVEISSRNAVDNALVLKAGDSARMLDSADAPVTLEAAHTEYALSWHQGGFKFSNHTVRDIMNELERRYNVRIIVRPAHLLNQRIGILLENPTGPEEIIRDICELTECQYRVIPDGFRISQSARK